MKKTNSIFWMRPVSFERIIGALQILKQKGPLQGPAFDAEGLSTGVLVGAKGKPFAKSTRNSYRKVMQKLGLITLEKRQYALAKTNVVQELLTVAAPWPQPLNAETKEKLAEIVTTNDDCWQVFFRFLAPAVTTSLAAVRTRGNALILSIEPVVRKNKKTKATQKLLPKVLLKPDGKQEIILTTKTSIAAVAGSLRLWASKLGITDEIRLDSREGLVIAPLRQGLSTEEIDQQLWITLLHQTIWEEGREWGMCYVPNLVRAMLVEAHISAAATQAAYSRLLARGADRYLLAVPTTSAFIVMKTQYWKQEPAFEKTYFRRNKGAYISHLRVSDKALKIKF